MCRCIGKILGKLLMTISVVVIFGLGAWISFDVYNTAVDFTDSKYMTASPYNATNGIQQYAYVRSGTFKIYLQDGYYDYQSKCYIYYYYPAIQQQIKVYQKIDGASPKVYVESLQYPYEQILTDIQCIDAQLIDQKGYYFYGLKTTVLVTGIICIVLGAIAILGIWLTGWINKKKDYVQIQASQYI